MRPGDVVNAEAYEAPPTGAPYMCYVYAKRSGGFAISAEQLDGPRSHWYSYTDPEKGCKTVKGATRAAQRLARGMEDVTYREGFDGS